MNTIIQKHFMEQQHYANNRPVQANARGFIMLVSVLVVGAVGSAIALFLLLSSIDASRNSLVFVQSGEAKAFANFCAEEALERLRESVYYSGMETFTFPRGTCRIETIAIVSTPNTNRSIRVTGTAGTITRKVRVEVATVHPHIGLSSWQEVADF